MPRLENGKTQENIINNVDDFIAKVIDNGHGFIAATRQHRNRTYYDLSDAYVVPDSSGDDMYMVNYHNDIGFEETTEDRLRDALIDYLNHATDAHKTSKATVRIRRTSRGTYELDNMRMYPDLQEAKRSGWTNRSDYVHSIATGKDMPL